jgi:hypothetical protein
MSIGFALAALAIASAKLSPFDPSVQLLGRFDSTARGAEISWSGTGMQIAFEGKSCQVRMGSTGAIVGVRVDAMPAKDIDLLSPTEDTLVVLAANLAAGRHLVEFVKKTEAQVGSLVIKEVVLDGKTSTLPRPGRRRIEFVGNSITCGYGVLDSVKEHGFSPRTQDFTKTYAWHATENLGGELQAVCWSGKGLARNYDGSTGQILPDLYAKSSASPDSKPWKFQRWKPDAVVVDAGQNDFAKAPLPDSVKWEAAWMEFLETIRKAHGNVPVVLVDGPMLSDYWPLDASGKPLPALTKVRKHLRNVAAVAKSRGFASVTVLDFTPNSPDRGYGADWHPNRAQQLLNGQELSDHLKKTLGW